MPVNDRWSLRGKTAVVTGGSKGIGKAVVDDFVQLQCAKIFVNARNKEDCERVAKEFTNDVTEVIPLPADLSTAEGRQLLVDTVTAAGPLHILVNNVGTNNRKPTLDYEDSEVMAIFNTNLFSFFHLTRRLVPAMSEGASIINIGSVAGIIGVASGVPYAMTKAAMTQATRNWGHEFAPKNIRVNCIAPWYIRTALTEGVLKGDYLQMVLDVTPANRVADPEEVSGLVAFLAMDQAGYITGQTVAIDGGFSTAAFFQNERQ
eukprot:Clim_evm61s142 gene=Clim_evmTU61s142